MRSLILIAIVLFTVGCKSSGIDSNEIIARLDAISARLDVIVTTDAMKIAKIEAVVNNFYTEFEVYRELTGSIQMRQAKRIQREAGRNIERMRREIGQ